MTQWIAEEKIVFIRADGTRVTGRIAVAAPVVREMDCACEVVLEGLERSHMIYGDSTLQALLLGVRFLGMQLDHYRSRGMRFELDADDEAEHDQTIDGDDDEASEDDENDEEIDIISVLFGPLLRG